MITMENKFEKTKATISGKKNKQTKRASLVNMVNGWRRKSKTTFSPFSSPSNELSDSLKIEKNVLIIYLNLLDLNKQHSKKFVLASQIEFSDFLHQDLQKI